MLGLFFKNCSGDEGVKYHFSRIFSSNNVVNRDLELLFTKTNLINFTLNALYHSGTHYTLVDSKQNRCLYFLVAKQLCEVAVDPFSANFTKWSNTLKQIVSNLPTNCLSVFEHFVGLALKW